MESVDPNYAYFLTCGKVWWQSAEVPPRLRVEKRKKKLSGNVSGNTMACPVVRAAIRSLATGYISAYSATLIQLPVLRLGFKDLVFEDQDLKVQDQNIKVQD